MDKIDLSQYPDRDEHEPYYKLLTAVNEIIDAAAAPELENENSRRKAIASLVEGAKGTPAAGLVNVLFRHYKEATTEYIQVGGDVLADAINDETDATTNRQLDTVLSADPADTVRARTLLRIAE